MILFWEKQQAKTLPYKSQVIKYNVTALGQYSASLGEQPIYILACLTTLQRACCSK